MIAADWDKGSAEANICVVGAGPVGLALAFKLEELGLCVTLVEMGGDDDAAEVAAGDIELENGHHARSRAISRPGIGGASALWGGRCVAFDDLDFEKRDHVPFSGWPISHEVLRPHYAGALEFLNCSRHEPALEDIGVADDTVATVALERWSKQPNLGPVYSERLKSSRRIRVLNGAVTRIVLDAAGRQVESLEASHLGKKVEVRAKAFVLAGGGLENARLLLSLHHDRPQLFAGPNSPLGRFYQGHLTGYIAVLQLDKPELARHFAFQLDDQGYNFRRRFQIAPRVQMEESLLNCVFWLDALSIADPIHGSGAFSLIYLFLKAFGLYRHLSNGLAPTARGSKNIDRRQHWQNIRNDQRLAGDIVACVRTLLGRRISRWRTLINPKGRYLLRYHAEQVPNPESRVSLRPQSGGGALVVDYRVVEQDLASVLKSHEILDGWLRRNGLGRLEYLYDAEARRQAVLNQAFDGYHQIGLTRMAASPADGVVDEDCRVHGLSNLYLAGSCLFSTGGHANPTLPAVALALRLAEHLKEESLAGAPTA